MRKLLMTSLCVVSLAAAAATNNVEKAKNNHGSGQGHRAPSGTNVFNVTVPNHDLDIILARPEDRSIAVSVQAHRVMAGSIFYGTQRDALTNQTPRIDMPIGEPAVFTLTKLSPDSQYYAEFREQSSLQLNTNITAFLFHTAVSYTHLTLPTILRV